MSKREKYEKSLLAIRFVGEELSEHGVNIYDFGSSLLAIQRIVNKAHLSMEGKLQKGAFPNKKEREMLSLCIGERKRTSDAFALVPLLTDLTTIDYLKTVADYVLSGIVGYYVGDVIKRISGENDQNKQHYIGSIHADVVNIVNRIDAAGGVDAIEIGSPALGKPTIAHFDEKAKEYVNRLYSEYYLGRTQTIKGYVYRLYPNNLIVTIRRVGGRKVNIHLDEKSFNLIRYNTGIDPLVSFVGKPRFKFGIESQIITDFEANSIEIENEG